MNEEYDMEAHKAELRRKIDELNWTGLVILELYMDWLVIRDWVKSIPVRWVQWQGGRHV